MKAMVGLTKGLMSMPMPWPLWLGLLLALNVAAPIYFFETLEAKVVLTAFLASVALMTAIFASKGFVRLLGIGHIFGFRWCHGCGLGSNRSSQAIRWLTGCWRWCLPTASR